MLNRNVTVLDIFVCASEIGGSARSDVVMYSNVLSVLDICYFYLSKCVCFHSCEKSTIECLFKENTAGIYLVGYHLFVLMYPIILQDVGVREKEKLALLRLALTRNLSRAIVTEGTSTLRLV